MPGILRTGNGSRNASAWCSRTTVSPSGFFSFEAIFAISLLGPIPTDALNRSRSRIACLMSRQTASAFSYEPAKLRSA